MTAKWIETITGDIVRWSDVTRVYYELTKSFQGQERPDEYASYFKTKNGEIKDFIDFYIFEDEPDLDYAWIHRKAVYKIEQSQDVLIRMWDVIESMINHEGEP